MNQKWRRLLGLVGAILALLLLLSGCGEKKVEKPSNPFVGDWTSPEMQTGYDHVQFRIINKGKPVDGIYVRFEEDGSAYPMKGDVLLSSHLKQLAQERGMANMEVLKALGNAFGALSYWVEGDQMTTRLKFPGKEAEEIVHQFKVIDENTIVLNSFDKDKGEEREETLTRMP